MLGSAPLQVQCKLEKEQNAKAHYRTNSSYSIIHVYRFGVALTLDKGYTSTMKPTLVVVDDDTATVASV
jgi:hypothetical protein